MHPIVYAAAILAVAFGLQALFSLRPERGAVRSITRKRLDDLAARLADAHDPTGASLVRGEAPEGFAARLRRLVPRIRRVDILLYRAGAPMTARQFWLATAALAGAGLFAGSVLGGSRAFAGAALGLVPTLVLLQKQRVRMGKLEAQLPEALELIARALRAGHSLTFGLQMVGDEMPEPVGGEFGQAARQVALGLEPRVAIAGISERIGSTDISFFVTAVLIQRETGGNLAEILENLAKVVRERFKMYGKVRALTAQTRMSANILMAMPVVMVALLSAVSPGYTKPLFETEGGHT